MELHPLLLCHPCKGVIVVVLPSPAESGALFHYIIGVLPVIALKAHLLCPFGYNPPVWLCLARRVIELLVQPEPSFTICTGKISLAPCSNRKDNISILCAHWVAQIDILINNNHAAAVYPLFKGINNILFKKAHHLIGVLPG